jgi:hypothetical protein
MVMFLRARVLALDQRALLRARVLVLAQRTLSILDSFSYLRQPAT